jgi:hypothetical protein
MKSQITVMPNSIRHLKGLDSYETLNRVQDDKNSNYNTVFLGEGWGEEIGN